ncbi:MAG: hypothetical protein ABIT37_23790 [Luteolibacter sp.]
MNTLFEEPCVLRETIAEIIPEEIASFCEPDTTQLDEHFRLNDLIHSYPVEDHSEELESLCRKQIEIAPELIASEKASAEINGSDFCPVAHAGYNRLSAILYSRHCWPDVVNLYKEAMENGWNVREMEERVEAARSAMSAR